MGCAEALSESALSLNKPRVVGQAGHRGQVLCPRCRRGALPSLDAQVLVEHR